MGTARQIIRGTVWNWIAMAITAIISFFVSPFLVHHLGNAAYGTWLLVNSMVAYLTLLDFGMRGAVVKFVSAHHARDEHDQANRAVSAALTFRIALGAAMLAISACICIWAPKIVHIPPYLVTAARWAILLNGTTLAIALSFGVLGGVLAALQRFDQLSILTILQSVFNATGVVIVLRAGGGIVGLAAAQLTIALFLGVATGLLVFRAYPQLRLILRLPDRQIVREFWGYSFFLFVIAVSGQVIYYTDTVVIGIFLPAAAVAFYGIGATLIVYLRELIASMATTFMPVASALHAKGDYQQLRRLLFQGTRSVLLIALPIEVGFLLRGPTFIRLWMGQQYAHDSGQVLQVLTIAWLFIAANYCSGNVLYGLAKHKRIATWTPWEALANLLLSVFLVRHMGIIGVAWGTVIPSLITNVVLWPAYVTKVLEIPLLTYIWQAWIRPAVAILPFALGTYFADLHWAAPNVWHFLMQMIMLLPLVAVGFALCFYTEIRRKLANRREQKHLVTAQL